MEVLVLSFDEEYDDDEEYIDNDNDPERVEKIKNEDYTIPTNDEIIELDEVFETIRTKIKNLTEYDHIKELKVLDDLRAGKFRV